MRDRLVYTKNHPLPIANRIQSEVNSSLTVLFNYLQDDPELLAVVNRIWEWVN